MTQDKKTMQQRLEEKLSSAFAPSYLQVVNDSASHKGHAGDDGSGESHFSVVMVSDYFKNMSHVDKQRRVYLELDNEMKIIHALSLNIKSD